MTDLTPEKRAELRELLEAATDGPWYWRNTQDVYLFGARSRVVMAFERMGMQGAQPVFRDANNVLFPAGKANLWEIPDARLIAEAVNALRALLDAADERDRLAAAVESLAEWHETKAMKARRFRIEINGENRVMDKAAEVHEDAARRIRRALDGTDE